MKNTIFILMISILVESGCTQNSPQKSDGQILKNTFNKDSISVLDFYRQYSSFTDPGEYKYLYKNLPDSLPELCSLIKSQFIHPFAELPQYRDQIPEERGYESVKYPTVKSILDGLLAYDSRGLVNDRKPKDRLILACRENAILLASILKYRGIPVRVRYGFAPYIEPNFHIGHVICEVWNTNENRWMLVDPTMNMVDFSRNKFDFSNDVWKKLQKKEIDPSIFGVMGHTGESMIVCAFNSDLASLLGTEYTFFHYSPIIKQIFMNERQVSVDQIKLINEISELMTSINADNLSKLQEIYNNTPEIQITKSFDPHTTKAENNTGTSNLSINKPTIEFVNIPAGTFTMGSPSSEKGRKDDEIQHQVTLSAFKMSKYTVTFEQYDAFCEATGRNKPGGRERGNLPVSRVTWDDAKAFAEWMGCRLPTEAEWEYAARANTTTPFYTGNCLTTDQANFNGDEPYSNCEKGINRNKPIPVGSFAPNTFGLNDIHGNMVEWCSDWYGEYNIDEKMNPKGPEIGKIKVFRGGGFWLPGWRCRSACRGGDPQGNRGAGLSFRIVKDE